MTHSHLCVRVCVCVCVCARTHEWKTQGCTNNVMSQFHYGGKMKVIFHSQWVLSLYVWVP